MGQDPVARRRYYTPFEVLNERKRYYRLVVFGYLLIPRHLLQVSQHNAPQDCWVSLLGEVFDVTSLTKVDLSRKHAVVVDSGSPQGTNSHTLSVFTGTRRSGSCTPSSSSWH